MIKDTVSFPDFQKLDLRVGKVVEAEEVEDSVNLVRMQVDLGMMKEESAGMILCADIDGQAVIIPVDEKIPEGTVVR